MLTGEYKRRSRPSKCGEDELSSEYVELDVPIGHQGGFNQKIHKNVYAGFSGVDRFNNVGLTLEKSPLCHLRHHTLQIPKDIDSGWLRLGMSKLQASQPTVYFCESCFIGTDPHIHLCIVVAALVL